MNVLMWILAAVGGFIGVMLLIGGIVFWRGWLYAVRHKDDMVIKRIELNKMLADNVRLMDDVERLERQMAQRNDGEAKQDD